MRFRKLRIAWSVVCGIACVLLIVLWVRSYWCDELCYWTNKNGTHTTIGANMGVVYFSRNKLGNGATASNWTYKNFTSHRLLWNHWSFWDGWNTRVDVGLPYWSFVLPTIVLGYFPWLPLKRFSVRTLLIATTLVAVVLGFAVYAIR
jgi:hypothetical protein